MTHIQQIALLEIFRPVALAVILEPFHGDDDKEGDLFIQDAQVSTLFNATFPTGTPPLVNLTPHVVNIILPNGEIIAVAPAGVAARCAVDSIAADGIPHRIAWESATDPDAVQFVQIPVVRQRFGAVQGLPAPIPGVAFIVSALVRTAVPERGDVFSPGELVRSAEGQPIGCKGLVCN